MRIFVGLSGGVDSAVSAYLLKKEGHTVVGAFIRGWEPDFLPCTGAQDRLEAMRVAAHLGIPFITYDLSEEYKREVVEPFIEEYRAGRTPNPDVMCNRTIKFGAFWERAKSDGADMIATGHYARNENGRLLRGIDLAKDQSYFLWMLTQNDLSHSLFPVGKLLKSEVRAIARDAQLPNAARKDSQGICFLGHVNMRDFLKRYLPSRSGIIYHTDGKALGEHDGAWFYTIGERIAVPGTLARMYVVEKNAEKNELIVSAQKSDTGCLIFELWQTNWISKKPDAEKTYEAQIRYHGELHRVKIEGTTACFEKPVLAASGQSLVVYDADGACLGGGIIAG